MKKTILTMAAIVFVAVTASTSYGQSIDKKSEKARENILESKEDLIKGKKDLKIAQKDSVAQYQEFKKEYQTKILNNEKSMADLKWKSTKADMENKADYEKNLTKLEQKNASLKKRLADYTLTGQTKWSSFKTSFGNDMDELEKELKNLTVENKK